MTTMNRDVLDTPGIKPALKKTRQWFKNHPNLWTQGTYRTKHHDKPVSYCLVGRFAAEMNTTTGRAHQIMSVLGNKLAEMHPGLYAGNEVMRNDLVRGRISTVNDLHLNSTDQLVDFLEYLEEAA